MSATFVRCELTDNNNNLLCVAIYMPIDGLNCADFVFIHSTSSVWFFDFHWICVTDIFFACCGNRSLVTTTKSFIRSTYQIWVGKGEKKQYQILWFLCREWNRRNEPKTACGVWVRVCVLQPKAAQNNNNCNWCQPLVYNCLFTFHEWTEPIR